MIWAKRLEKISWQISCIFTTAHGPFQLLGKLIARKIYKVRTCMKLFRKRSLSHITCRNGCVQRRNPNAVGGQHASCGTSWHFSRDRFCRLSRNNQNIQVSIENNTAHKKYHKKERWIFFCSTAVDKDFMVDANSHRS